MAYDSDIHLAMIIPSIKSYDQFELLRASIIPKRVKKNFYYRDTESEYIAISVDTYLNQAEFDACQLGFCTLNSPIYQVQDSTSCLMTAFLGNEIDTKRNCNYQIDPFPSSVIGDYNMTVLIWEGNYISFTIAAGLIRLHMPGVKKSRM